MASSSRRQVLSLAIWGPPSSGKTHLLAMINSYCDTFGWTLLPAVLETSDYIEQVNGFVFNQGRVAPPTDVSTPFLHRFVVQRRGMLRRQEFVLEMPDAAGEIYANPEHPVFNMINYLNTCSGIMWLLDPVAIKKNVLYGTGANRRSYYQMIYRNLSRIYQTKYQSRGRIDKYMAFVLTKMDHPDHVRYMNDPMNYALDLLGKQVQHVIESFCVLDRVKFFSTSALGFVDPEQKLSNLDETDPQDVKLKTTDFEPVGVFEPLDWLFTRLT